jgi:hypothetical protein
MTEAEELQALAETSSFDLAREVLALRHTVKQLEWFSTRVSEAQLYLHSGQNPWIYPDCLGLENLLYLIHKLQGWEKANEDE